VLAAEAPAADGKAGGGKAARRGRFLALVLAAAAISFAGIASHSLWTPDEPRDAAVGKNMWRSGDLVVPRLNGRPFLEKPPLAWWAQTAAYRLLGASDATARVPAAVFATLTLLVAYAISRRLGGPRAGWLAAGVLASTVEYAEDMGRAIVDPPLVLAVALTYLGFILLVGDAGGVGSIGEVGGLGDGGDVGDIRSAGGRARLSRRYRGHLLVVLAVPLAFLAKGVVGLGLALEPPLVYLLGAAILADWRARRRGQAGGARGPGLEASGEPSVEAPGALRATVGLLAPLALTGVPLFAAAVLPWALALYHQGGAPMLRETLINNTVGRLFSTDAGRAYGHRQPFWYYVTAGAPALLPWTLTLPAVLRGYVGRGPRGAGGYKPGSVVGDGGGGALPAERAGRFLLALFFLGAALLSVAASKRTVYLVPLLAPLAVPIALWLDRLGSDPPGGRQREAQEAFADLSRDRESRPGDPGSRAWDRGTHAWDRGSGAWDRGTALLLLGLAAALPVILWTVAALAALPAAPAFQALTAFPPGPLRATVTHGRLAAAGVLALAASALLLARFASHLRRGSTPTAPWLVVPYLLLTLIYQTALKAAVDPLKNPHDLTAAVARLDPGRGAVAAFRPSETTEGIMGFDLDRRVEPLDTPADLAAFLARRPQGRVILSLEALRSLPADLRDRLCLLYDESATKASPFVLAAPCAGARQAP
jgi:4-amino-4-deoxy-L-arabinose transferase-like glycosyltransferase